MEDAEGRANYLAEGEALGSWRLGDEYFQRFMSASADDVQRVARKYLAEQRAAALVYRPESLPVVPQESAEMQPLLGAGRSVRLESIPPRTAPATAKKNAAEFEKEEAGVSVFRMAEGIPVLVRRKVGTPIASIGIYIIGGAVEEEDNEAGLTLLTARTMLKGTTSRTAAQIADGT